MLQDLPIEVLQQIVSNLPTASSIVNLASTNKKIYQKVSANDYSIFRTFVQKNFPTIDPPPIWRSAAYILTSRSRAWDRRAFMARECLPSPDDTLSPGPVEGSQKFGYVPVIDSYETWQQLTSDRKEVLTWGAAGRLRLRITEKRSIRWSSLCTPGDHLPENDILDVRLLRPHQNHAKDGETIILRRANRDIIKLQTQSQSDLFSQESRYIIPSNHVDCMDISRSADPILAVSNTKHLNLYPLHSEDREVRPAETIQFEQSLNLRHRKRCIKFLSDNTIAVGIQFIEGRDRAPIFLYDINSRTSSSEILIPTMALDPPDHLPGRHGATTLAPLDNHSNHPGCLFLSGWTDGLVRLHDTRASTHTVMEYTDVVDDGQILSLLPIGCERFLAGSHQNACLKSFDMRMPGARVYSHFDACLPQKPPNRRHSNEKSHLKPSQLQPKTRRDMNIFLALSMNHVHRPWQPLPRQNNFKLPRYRGSIYSLSAPSSMSPTVYAGIENHVIQLDFMSTGDLHKNSCDAFTEQHGVSVGDNDHVLNLSCYERPREGHESTDPVLLRKQLDWTGPRSWDKVLAESQPEEGWDERWRLATYEGPTTRGEVWRWRRGRR